MPLKNKVITKISKNDLRAILTREGWPTLGRFFAFLAGAFFFFGSQLLAPLHVPLSLLLVFLALRVVYRFIKKRQVERGLIRLKNRTWRQLVAYRLLALSSILLVSIWYTYISLVPTDQAVFTNQPSSVIRAVVDADTIEAAQLVDLLTVTGDSLLETITVMTKQSSLSPQDQDELGKAWNDFLGVAILSEAVTEVHRYFPQISFWRERELQVQSFTIAYALYMKKFAYFHDVVEAVGGNTLVRTILNEPSSAFGGPGSYRSVTDRYFATDSFLRRNVGYLYYLLLSPRVKVDLAPEYAVIKTTAKESYFYLASQVFSQVLHRGLTFNFGFQERVGDAWLPIQKTVFVNTIGNIHVGDRKTKFITKSDIDKMKPSLRPGDIFVARKNWYASNVGIPGFWTHVGIFTGTLPELEEYFSSLFPYTIDGVSYQTFRTLLLGVNPEAHATYLLPDEYGYMPSVVESETRGTRIQSIEYSAAVDYFGVLRPELPKEAVLLALLQAFSQQGKPYDYEFNLLTKSEFFCSELVFDAYEPRANRPGLTFPRSIVSGRELIAPNDIVKQYATKAVGESGLSFVYFLDGVEEEGVARRQLEAAFQTSYLRPKFSFLQL